jgi:hypothetical protein
VVAQEVGAGYLLGDGERGPGNEGGWNRGDGEGGFGGLEG